MDLGLTGRTAMVAGASTGLGFAVAHALAREGTNVSIAARRPEPLEEAAASLRNAGSGAILATPLDVRDDAAVRAWVDRTVAELGPPQIVVANAGGPPAGMASSFSVDGYRDALELNLTASVGLVLTALPHIRAAGRHGRILFITSISVKQPVPNLALSNTARPGLLGFAKSLVDELGDLGVTINVLAPGLTRTARLEELAGTDPDALQRLATDIPLGRVGEPEEFGAAAAFLASERATYITGTVLLVDGGAHHGLM